MPDPLLTLDAPASPADTASGDTAVVTRTDPIALEAAPGQPPAAGPRYVLGEEIARGGMGAVCRATDTVLGREVAVKTLQSRYGPDSSAARRFAGEARITGQLQHPAIPPVHDLGTLPDGRPFLAMKLIRGDTLDESLRERPDIAHGRGRFVAAFEQICHAVAYAHACGVIHRDLKPANVMVGAFGEVQVMDWGLARSGVRIPEARADAAGKSAVSADGVNPLVNQDGVETFQLTSETPEAADELGRTQTGQVMGTPAYMAPEQARADAVDARSDVFALGGILCKILTGKPPFAGHAVGAMVRLAAAGDVGEAVARLDGCGADAELVALAKRCLAPEAAGRPADGKAVAEAVAAYRAGVEERLRQAQSERAAAEARVIEQRKRRKVQLALGLSVGLILLGGGGFALWRNHKEDEAKLKQVQFDGEQKAKQVEFDTEQRTKGDHARERAKNLLVLAVEARREYRYDAAKQNLQEAGELAAKFAPDITSDVDQAKADLAFVRELDAVRMNRSTWVAAPEGGGPDVADLDG